MIGYLFLVPLFSPFHNVEFVLSNFNVVGFFILFYFSCPVEDYLSSSERQEGVNHGRRESGKELVEVEGGEM